jgi:hypothetical protein
MFGILVFVHKIFANYINLMSIQNILTPNSLALYCGTLNGSPFPGSLTVTELGSAIYYIVTSTAIANELDTPVIFDTADSTNVNLAYNLTNGQFTIVNPGIFTFSATVAFSANAVGHRNIFFTRNSATPNVCSNSTMGLTDSGIITTLTSTYSSYFNIGEIVTLLAYQQSGGALNLVGFNSSQETYCQIDVSIITQIAT